MYPVNISISAGNLFTFTKEILNEKLHFCVVCEEVASKFLYMVHRENMLATY